MQMILSRSLTLGRCRNAERQADPSGSTARAFEAALKPRNRKVPAARPRTHCHRFMRFGSCRMALSAAYTVIHIALRRGRAAQKAN